MFWCGYRTKGDLYSRLLNFYLFVKCFIPKCKMPPPPISYAGVNDSSSDTEDYHETDDRRRRVFKNRLRYVCVYGAFTLKKFRY